MLPAQFFVRRRFYIRDEKNVRARSKYEDTRCARIQSSVKRSGSYFLFSATECLLLDASSLSLLQSSADPWTGSNSPEDGASSSVNTVSISFLRRHFRFTSDRPRSSSQTRPVTFSSIIDSGTRYLLLFRHFYRITKTDAFQSNFRRSMLRLLNRDNTFTLKS